MTVVGMISYGLGAAAFAVFALLLMTAWRGHLSGGMLLLACLVTVVWAGVLAYHSHAQNVPQILIFGLEMLRYGVWLVFLVGLLAADDHDRVPKKVRFGLLGLWLAVLFVGPITVLLSRAGVALLGDSRPFLLGAFLLALAGLVVVEQLYRNTRPDLRWGMKYLCFGCGGMFAYDIYLYADGLLFRQLDLSVWNARGAVNALVMPLLAVTAARNPTVTQEVFVSRRVAFFTTSLFGTGLYLLVMAAGGYYIRLSSASWGAFAQLVFLFGAFLLLMVILFSGQARSRLKVFLSKHFYKQGYDYREEWHRLTRTLSTPAAEVLLEESALRAVAEIVDSPGGALWLEDGGRLRPAAAENMPLPTAAEVAQYDSLFEFLMRTQWIVDLAEYRADPDKYAGLELPHWLRAAPDAWLIVPLFQLDALLGFMLLLKARAMRPLGWEDHDLLKTVGQQVAGYLAQHKAANLLTEARQFQAYNRFTAFIMHDLKNLIAQQSLVVKNAAKFKDNPDFIEDAIATVDNSVRRMNRLLEQLQRGDAEGALSRSSLTKICNAAMEQCRHRQPAPELQIEDDGLFVQAGPRRLAMVLGHLVRNAQDATPGDGKVTLSLRRQGDQALVEVRDNGSGMDAGFVRERLFKPFDTTKGSKGMGIGAYQSRESVRSLGGDLKVVSAPGEGSSFTILIPLAPAAAEAAPDSRTGVAQ